MMNDDEDQSFKFDMQATQLQWTNAVNRMAEVNGDKIMQDLKRWDDFSDLKFVMRVYGCREDDGSEPDIQLKAG